MTRSLSPAILSELSKPTINVAYLLKLELDSGDVRLWTGEGILNWNGEEWLGAGAMANLSAVREETGLRDGRITATLSHIPIQNMPDFVQEFSDNNPVGRNFSLYLAFFGADTALIDVMQLTAGFVDEVNLNDANCAGGGDDKSGGIELTLANESAKLARTQSYRLTDQHQRRLFPGDRGLEFVTDTNLGEIRWGQADPQSVGGAGGAGVDGGAGSKLVNRARH